MQNQRVEVPTLAAVADSWLQDVPWQLFGTFSFASPQIGQETAINRFTQMTEGVAKAMRSRIGYVYSLERRSKSTGAVVPLHFHAAFVAPRPIEHQLVSGMWWGLNGPKGTNLDRVQPHDLAQVQPYDPSRGGVEYVVKQMTDPDCQWGLKNVELFSPSMPKHHISPRSIRRWQEQLGGVL